jgi:hypothetical protein
VVVEQRSSTAWRRIGRLQARPSGVFSGTFRSPTVGWVRARVAGETTLPFSLQTVADRFFNPFGNPTLLEPKP